MCGRARCSLRADDVPRACHRRGGPVRSIGMDRYRPSYNVAPGSNIPVVRREDGSSGDGFVLHCMKWGLIPSFTKKTEKPDFFKMFNARSESLTEKASFRRLLPKSRCLVAAEGFYEWKKDGSKKQPYYIHFKDGRPLVFAALYDRWENSEGEQLYTFTIVTTSSSSTLQWLHDRMPVILGDKESTDTWLNGSSAKLDLMLKPYEDPDLVWYPVTLAIGKLSFDGPDCVKELKSEGKNTISRFFSANEVKREQQSSIEKRSLSNKSASSNLPRNIKKECATEDNEEILFSAEKEDRNSKSSVPILTAEEGGRMALAENIKVEPKTQEDQGVTSSAEKGEHESKLTKEDTLKWPRKRDHEESSCDSESAKDASNAKKTAARKKANSKNTGDKQPTLFSYFGKK